MPTKPATTFRIGHSGVIASAIRLALGLFAFGMLCSQAFAQSTADPVLPGSLTTSGCEPGFASCYIPYSASNPLPVTPSAPTGTQDTNLKQVGGATVTLGQGTKSQSVPVTIASDQGQATASVPINVSTATTTQLVAINGSKSIYVSHYDWISGGTGNVTLEYGTGTTCGTGTTVLTGPYGMLAGSGISVGTGASPVLFVPSGNALCILTSAAVQISGVVSYVQP